LKALLWVLDINSEAIDNSVEIRLWGLDGQGRRVLVRDQSFLPYFVLVLNGKREASDVLAEIGENALPSIASVEVLDRRYFGSPVKALKVTVKDPTTIAKYARELSKLRGVEARLEDDLRHSYLYLVDNDVNPCVWQEVDVEETQDGPKAQVDMVYMARSKPERRDKLPRPPELKILSVSIISHSPVGAPKPEINPIDIISCATNTGSDKQFVTHDAGDETTIKAFIEYLWGYDPDIIATFGGNTFDLPFLLERARRCGLKLRLDRLETEPHRSVYGHIAITGRANIDLADFSDEIQEVKVKTLENITAFLGIRNQGGAGGGESPIENVEYADYWENPKKRTELITLSQGKAKLILRLAEDLLGFAEELSSLSGLPLDQVGPAAVGFRIESYIMRQALKYGELVPPRLERPYQPYQGAIVLKPEAGLHEDVAVLDFKSMYPNLMIAFNISPDTYVPPKEPDPPGGVNTAPEVGHRFRKTPPGLYSKVLRSLIGARELAKAEMKGLKPGSSAYRVLDARQRAIKVMTNAAYGYAGWIGARWYMREVAEAAAAWGRQTITTAIDMARKTGLQVIYGDTDSIFIKYDKAKTGEFTKAIETKLGLEIRPDEVFTRVLFTEAKKRYAGLLPDGRLDIVGLEVARGDWTEAAKTVQERVLEILLKEKDAEKAAAYVREEVSRLRSGKVPLPQLVIWKTLTKAPKEYAVRAAHVEVAKRLADKGWHVTVGDKVGYVITKGKGQLYQRAVPYVFSKLEDVDLDYYEEQQIIPSALRVLGMFGIAEADLRP
jgi:DNA polymerase I